MLSRFKPTHYHWGRPLEQCIQNYHVSATSRSKNGDASRLAANAAAEKIGRLSTCTDTPNAKSISESITISSLRAILRMTEDRCTYHFFLSSGLVEGCIALMQSMYMAGTPPLSYEYGYLCLRIILFTLGTHLLQRSQNLELALKSMDESPRIELPLTFSNHVSHTVMHLVQPQISGQGGKPNRSLPGRGAMDSELALAPPDQIVTLIDILWKDRVNLLRAIMSTYVPALPGLLFMLSHFLCVNPSLSTRRIHGHSLLFKALEINYFCISSGTKEQTTAFDMIMCEITEAFESKLAASPKFTKVNASDVRTLFDVYVQRLNSSDARLYSPIDSVLASVFMELLVSNKDSNSEELLPSVIELTSEVLWKGLIDKEGLDIHRLRGFYASIFISMRALLKPTAKVDQSMQEKTITSLAKSDLLNLIGMLLLRLEPKSKYDEHVPYSTRQVREFMKALFDCINEWYPRHVLEKAFQPYVPDLIKIRRQLIMLRNRLEPNKQLNATEEQHKENHRECVDTWTRIAEALGQVRNIGEMEASPRFCQYPRCPNPEGTLTNDARYVCSGCNELIYCGLRCQANDWQLGEGGSHSQTCEVYAESHTPNASSPTATNALAHAA